MIKFIKLEVEGFASIVDPITYPLSRAGVNILTGANGAGKSTIPCAIIWVIYGKLLGKSQVEPWEDLVDSNFTGTKVSMYIKVDNTKIKITRCRSYTGKLNGAKGANRLLLYVDGVYQEQYRNTPDVQARILELVEFTFDVFINSIILGQNFTRILDATGERQKVVMDEAFNTLYITKARDRAKIDLESLNIDVYKTKTEARILNEKIIGKQTQLDNSRRSIENFKSLQKERMELLNTKIAEYRFKLCKLGETKKTLDLLTSVKNEILNNLKPLPETQANLKTLELQALRTEMVIQQNRIDLNLIKKQGQALSVRLQNPNVCPTCGRSDRSQENSPTKIQAEIKLNQKTYKTIDLRKSGTELELQKINSSIEKIKNKIIYLNKHSISLGATEKSIELLEYSKGTEEFLKRSILDKQTELEMEGNRKPQIENLKKTKKELRELVENLETNSIEVSSMENKLELLNWVINDPLSNKGLKAYIFNQLLKEVSQRTRYYSKYSGIAIDFSINLDAVSKPLIVDIISNGVSRPYSSLSGGQKQLANITASLAIHDVVSNSRKVNFIFLDEIFENLDKSNIQIVSDLVGLRGESQSVHLITHRTEFSIHNSKIIEVALDSNNRSKINL